ncbi:MAG: CCA tRNA nucleotidyltransferase [Methanobacteriota archaeon]|nr:MAG: CCA tRNA nucleotidyltransferase [Euryarchaeota archaeon]
MVACSEEERKNIIAKLSPTKEELAELNTTYNRLVDVLSPLGKVELMGSLAKHTIVHGKKELDVFVFFEKGRDLHSSLASIHEALKRAFPNYKIESAYAQHPYLRLKGECFKADIVPAYDVELPMQATAVDRTRFHVSYINKHLPEDKRGDVLLLKQFLSNIGSYGAEIRIGGFSGYLCELLIIKFGSFEKALKALADYRGEALYIEEEPSKEFDEPFVFIDPVDRGRNVGSPIREGTLKLTKRACSAYLKAREKKDSSAESVCNKFFFFDGKKEVENKLLSLSFSPLDVVDDIRFGVLWRLATKLSYFLEGLGFDVLSSYVFNEESRDVVTLEVLQESIEETYEHRGPPTSNESAVASFKKENENTYVREGRIYAKRKRKCSQLIPCVKLFLSRYKPKLYEESPTIEIGKAFTYVERQAALKEFINSILEGDAL